MFTYGQALKRCHFGFQHIKTVIKISNKNAAVAQTLACYNACTTLQIRRQRHMELFLLWYRLSCMGCPYCRRVASGWLGALVLTMQVRLAGWAWNPTESWAAWWSLSKGFMGVPPFVEHEMSFLKIHFLKELIIHRLHDKLRLSFNCSLAI